MDLKNHTERLYSSLNLFCGKVVNEFKTRKFLKKKTRKSLKNHTCYIRDDKQRVGNASPAEKQ